MEKRHVHESTYSRFDLAATVHRNRLALIKTLFAHYVAQRDPSWADFGCSNGFVIEQMLSQNFRFSRIQGFDHSPALLDLARAKQIPGADFQYIDLNQAANPLAAKYDLATCFETLEHVGDLGSALDTIVGHIDEAGLLICTVPNETGLTGLVKLFGRMLTRRSPYGDFFARQRLTSYVAALLQNRRLDRFREPLQPGYGPHLGFDYRTFEEFVEERFVRANQLELLERGFTRLKMNLYYVFRKIAA
jgi:2-polyprenyl-3-methyl-5-hydroxy-6-metoxy-1,4-benzoquinol methylase